MKNVGLKRILTTAFCIMLLLSVIFVISSCKKEHVHTLEETVLTAATCEGEGVLQKKCTDCECDYVSVTTIPALGHNDKKISMRLPTCTEEGHVSYVKCERCERSTLTSAGILSALGHDMGEYGAEPSTCHSYGYSAGWKCMRTGCYYIEYYPQKLDYLAPHKDTDIRIVEATEATCQPGNHEYEYCKWYQNPLCGYNQMVLDRDTYYIEPLYDHVYATTATMVPDSYVEPTCDSDGFYYMAYFCTTCDTEYKDAYRVTIPALGHDIVTHSAKAPTCTEFGWQEYKVCSRCDHSEVAYVDIAPLGHTDTYTAGTPATCLEPGLTEGYYCSVCDEIISGCDPIAPLGHNEKSARVLQKNPTCLEDGSYVRVIICLNSCCEYNVDVSVVDKDNIDEFEFLFIQEEPIVINKLGHAEVKHDGKAATCLETGWNEYVTCLRCDYTTYSMTEALGHTEGTPANCTEAAVCATCGKSYDEAEGHNIVNVDYQAPTCMDHGWEAYDYCTKCDYTTYVEIPTPTNGAHNPGAVVVENYVGATCTANGGYDNVTYCTNTNGNTVCGVECSRTHVTLYATDHNFSQITGYCQNNCGDRISIGLEYSNNEDETTCVVSGIGQCTDTVIIIPDEINGRKVVGIAAEAFYADAKTRKITKVVIGDNVKTIGYAAFYGCINLKSVTIGSGVTSIANEAFDGCNALSEVYCKGGVAKWNSISIGYLNAPLTSATRYYI